MKIPTIDLRYNGAENGNGLDNAEENRIAEEIHKVFTTIGFAHLKNHGVDQELMEQMFKVSAEYFKLPLNVKCKIKRSPVDNGYLAAGREVLETNKPGAHELRESYDVLDPNGPYPDEEAPQLRSVMSKIFHTFHQLAMHLAHSVAISLGINRDFFSDLHKHVGQGVEKNPSGLRTLFYPPLDEDPPEEGVVRCGGHSDWGTLTLLVQDEMGGLEILIDGKWIPVDPVPGTILMNFGDMVPVWTSNKYKATVHRVRVPQDEKRRRSPRQSFAFFLHPDNKVKVTPLDGSADEQTSVDALQYLHNNYARVYKY